MILEFNCGHFVVNVNMESLRPFYQKLDITIFLTGAAKIQERPSPIELSAGMFLVKV